MSSSDSAGEKRFRAVYRCATCRKELSWDQVMGGHGCCPFCGHLSDSTVCDYVKSAELAPKKRTIEEGIDEFLKSIRPSYSP